MVGRLWRGPIAAIPEAFTMPRLFVAACVAGTVTNVVAGGGLYGVVFAGFFRANARPNTYKAPGGQRAEKES